MGYSKTMNTAAERIIHECFDNFERAIPGLVIPAGTFQERFDSVQKACSDRVMQIFVLQRVTAEIFFYKSALTEVSPDNLNGELATHALKMLFFTAIDGVATSHQKYLPVKRQHWIPACFLKRFATSTIEKRGKSRNISKLKKTAMSWRGDLVEQGVNEGIFIHKPVTNFATGETDGFMDQSLERTFAHWERNYAAMMTRITVDGTPITSLDLAVAYVFALLSEIRKPDEKRFFAVLSVHQMVEGFCNLMNRIENPEVSVVFNTDCSVFSSVATEKMFKSGDGVSAMLFPLSFDVGLVVSSAKISQSVGARIVKRHQESLIHNMSKGKFALYGHSLGARS